MRISKSDKKWWERKLKQYKDKFKECYRNLNKYEVIIFELDRIFKKNKWALKDSDKRDDK
jgi:hypothetical protein